MAIFTWFLCFCFALGVKRGSAAACDEGWDQHESKCYKFIANPVTWSDAELSCLNSGGNLASVHTFEEYTFLQKIVQATAGKMAEAWIGAQDATQENVWLWSDGSRFDYTYWAPRQPDNAGGIEDCVQMNAQATHQWNDLPCSRELPYLCEKDL
ncbi:ladderlectin-like isoform X2 [Chanos chanos]|uniref:Ladderlectin-like isoform X2 n=1 Tax=Chanos chanos TaxID=29144 RepID=A0A6J2VY54_CHACN|nr:ladderlectin-like isoform X2 [Chanos chanos]